MTRKMYWGVAILILLLVTAAVFVILREIADNRELNNQLAEVEELVDQINQRKISENNQSSKEPVDDSQQIDSRIGDDPSDVREADNTSDVRETYEAPESHLSDVAKHALGETQTDVIDAWIKETEPLLYDGNRTEVVARMRALEKQNPEVSEILEREARYFEKHKKRMQSKTFREKGYQIGRGVIESACPHVVQERCP